jgi:hypothetical protein
VHVEPRPTVHVDIGMAPTPNIEFAWWSELEGDEVTRASVESLTN